MIEYFCDESGDLGINGSKYFVITVLEVKSQKDYKKVENIISRSRKNKFKNELRYHDEIKAYKSSKKLKFHLLNKLNNTNVKFHSIIMDKENYKNSLILKSKKPFKLYQRMILELLFRINVENRFTLTIDKFLFKRKIKSFNENIINNLNTSNDNIKVYHNHSQKIKGLQIADLVAWSTFQYFEKGNPEYIKKLNNHQVFEYW